MTSTRLLPRHTALLRWVITAAQATQPGELEAALKISRPTLNRDLRELLGAGFLEKIGDGRSTRYAATDAAKAALGDPLSATSPPSRTGQLQWSAASLPLVQLLQAPLGTRTPVGYDNRFVDDYIVAPEESLQPS
jgi:DNA-binding transcriptional ArsR family regulator